MFISDINTKVQTNKKTILSYIAISIFCILVNNIYGIFGHGVSSNAMTFMFLVPLFGGAVFYLLMGLLLPVANRIKGYRLFSNLYNSGIATLTVGCFLKGILDIAGTSSEFTKFFYLAGGILIAVDLLYFAYRLLMAIGTKED